MRGLPRPPIYEYIEICTAVYRSHVQCMHTRVTVTKAKCLGVTGINFAEKHNHVNSIANKGNKILGFKF